MRQSKRVMSSCTAGDDIIDCWAGVRRGLSDSMGTMLRSLRISVNG